MHLPLEIMLPQEDGAPPASSPSTSSFRKQFPTKQIILSADAVDFPQKEEKSRKITFSKRVKVKKIRSYKHYSNDERDAIWYSPEEYTDFKKKCLTTLRKMREVDFRDCDEFSSRGLEVRTKTASMARKETRAFATRNVLDEQEQQKLVGFEDSERIREVYVDVSQTSSLAAQALAKRDENAANEYLGRQ